MKQLNHQNQAKGFAHVGVIVAVILVVAAIALGGWYVWNKNKKNESKQSNNSTQTQQQTNTEEEKQTKDPSEGGKYLVIQEWGVRFPLPEELRGDVYYKVGTNSITKLQRASFASTKLDRALGNFSCSFKENPKIDGLSAGLLRLSPQDQPAPSYITDNLDFIKKLEGYEYFTPKQTSPPITCLTGQHEELNNLEQSISGQLNEAFKTIEPAQQS